MSSHPHFPNSPIPTKASATIAGVPTKRRPSGSPPRSPSSTPASAFEYEMGTGRKPNAGFMEDFLIISGLIAVQIVGAFYTVLLKPILSLGINPPFLIIFGCLAMAFFIFPFAIALEKKKWPSKLSFTLVVQFVLIALGGVTTFQALMFVGIKKTSPAVASAMPNLAPGIIFIIAACIRLEKLDFKCYYTRTKITGTLVCLAGAVALSLLQSPVEPSVSQRSSVLPNPSPENAYKDWLIGCSCLLGAVLVLSCSTVLQAATMMEFPAPFSLCAVTSLVAAILTAVVQFITEGKLDFGQPIISIQAIISFVLLGGMLIALCVAFQTWAVLRKGPVMVSMFSPIQTVCSAVLSAIILGQVVRLESLVGMLAMFLGLYMVLWAKEKEGFGVPNAVDQQHPTETTGHDEEEGIERPLLT
ncbi:WAT1-related protein At5g47470-like [Phalaenopsis equestris]|uniref:WAT1-related protein At5g47470-like n=1 Tax=Phalaenopsis equestris TaxID=78828 RepID=UPI0009E3ABBC|nr:WAT1-related protein At5g47470-like [Phalaenopsis equestris]